MKKLFCFVLLTLQLIVFTSCNTMTNEDDLANEIHVISNNDIFTDNFFVGLKAMHFYFYDNRYANKPLTSTEDMQDVCDIFKNLTLTETNKKEYEDLVGNLGLTFTFTDGNEKTITFTDAIIIYEDNAYIPDKPICEEIRTIYENKFS